MRIPIALLAVMVLLVFSSMALAAHPPVTVKDSAGTDITDGTTPYSPKQTCSGCHFYNVGAKAFVSTQDRSCTINNVPNQLCATDYANGTGTVNKQMFVKSSAGTWVQKAFDVAVPMHGVSVGKHSDEGRNEALVNNQRTTWGAPKTISSPGMFGRF